MSTVKTTPEQIQPQVDQASDSAIQKIPGRRPMKKAGKAAPQKSASAFRTISEVAGELKVEQHVLRFWETKFTQIKPLKRGGGRRYYRPEDIELLKNIHHLLYNEGYTIKGVQKLLSATRGNLASRVEGEGSALPRAVAKNKDELAAMLDELKSMRRLIEQ